MKIEKLNDNQIRCTLTREDLLSRHINLIELAYGTEKAKSLFREMMQQAANEFGFEADDIPIMVEAIPMSTDSLTLIITKVEDPDELDTRFSKFSPDPSAAPDPDSFMSALKIEGADDIINLIKKIREARKNLSDTSENTAQISAEEANEAAEVKRIYRFLSLDDVICAARVLTAGYPGENTLYKNPQTSDYYLILESAGQTPEEFNRVCNTLSEYGENMKYSAGGNAYLAEHGKAIILNNAVQQLSAI